MSTAEPENQRVAMWWVLVFVLLAIGLGAVVVMAVGGQLVVPGA